VPLALFYGLRLGGVSLSLALLAGTVLPVLGLAIAVATRRGVDRLSLFTLTLLGVGTALGMVTADPRALLARESCLTAVNGLWILASLRGDHRAGQAVGRPPKDRHAAGGVSWSTRR
jgi:hypothetical protein